MVKRAKPSADSGILTATITPEARGTLAAPGDPGATRRPGQKREHYRTGEEAELRHIARKHKWWE